MDTASDTGTLGFEAAGAALKHYGVKGMKWGVRRRRGSSGKVDLSEDAAAARALLQRPAKAATNAEIQAALNRMRLESQFRELQLQAIPQSRMTRAVEFTKKLVADNATQQIQRVAQGASAIAVEQALSRGGLDGVRLDKSFAKEVGTRITPGSSKKSKKLTEEDLLKMIPKSTGKHKKKT